MMPGIGVPLSQQVAFIQETESLLFHRWRRHWQRVQSARQPRRATELTDSQLHAAMLVRFEKQVTVSKLAELLGVSRPSASVMVERLVAKGALVRESDPRDRRRVILGISPEFQEHIDEAEESRRRFHMELAREIGLDAVGNWYLAMQRIREVFEAEGGDGAARG